MKLSWRVLNFNFNANRIEDYDVLAHKIEWIKKTKKKCKTKAEFAELLDREMMWQYWSKAEYELVLEKFNKELWLKPWCGSRDVNAAKVDVSNDSFWQEFSKSTHCRWWDDFAKLDIYDQLRFKWEEFVDYCWFTRLPYERKRKDE